MAQLNDKASSRSWPERLEAVSNYVVIIVTHRGVRVALMVLFIAILVWLSVTRGYQPLTEEVQLPASILEHNPGLDIKTLQAINTLRAERVRRERPDYSNYGRVLVAPAPNE